MSGEVIRRAELLRRVRDLAHNALWASAYTPGQTLCAELAELETEVARAIEALAKDIDDLMAGRYERYNRPPPAFDVNGMSGRWGGWTAERERSR